MPILQNFGRNIVDAKLRLLVVDDDAGHRNTLRTLLGSWGYAIHVSENGRSAVDLVRAQAFSLVLMDLRMPDLSGIEAMKEILECNPSLPVIIMTAYSDVETAVAALKAGAYDYLTKPLDFDDLKLTLGRALDHAELKRENSALKKSLTTQGAGDILGRSEKTRRLLEMVDAIAPAEATVLLTGESGTGKELVARLLHRKSPRASGPFVTVNCAALSETLLESELYGHEKGAFTGADKRREGRFRAADTGTIFLDEIGEMPTSMQAKLLRAIQEREIQRVGGDRPITVDVRIIAATNRDLPSMVRQGAFRKDLYYRINVVPIFIPPLRERKEDIVFLTQAFLDMFNKRHATDKKLHPQARRVFLEYPWPGNVRELENIIERLVVTVPGAVIHESDLSGLFSPAGEEEQPSLPAQGKTLKEIMDAHERMVLRRCLREYGTTRAVAAALGINQSSVVRKMQRLKVLESG